MEPWRERFLKEYAELSERIKKLKEMIGRCKVNGTPLLDNTPVPLLEAQLSAMQAYKAVLDTRCIYEGHKV